MTIQRIDPRQSDPETVRTMVLAVITLALVLILALALLHASTANAVG